LGCGFLAVPSTPSPNAAVLDDKEALVETARTAVAEGRCVAAIHNS
jgi:hypothetical protein